MPGFIGTIGSYDINISCKDELLSETIGTQQCKIERHTVNKFLSDKLFFKSEEYIVVLDGVIFNKLDLLKQYECSSWQECFLLMYLQKGESFFKDFRGTFSGFLFDIKSEKGVLFTDQIGDKCIFYTSLPSGIIFSSEMNWIVNALKLNSFSLNVNQLGAYMSLTHGFMLEDQTLVENVKRLAPGHYLKIEKNNIEEIEYHRFSNKPLTEMTIEEAILGIDSYFKQAIKRQFDKDIEYGYDKHLTCLSGGLDSRMTVWVSHILGYSNQLNTNFSESNYLDFTIAQQIAIDLHHDFLFSPLDNGDFLKYVDSITPLTYGNVCFFGLAHSWNLYHNLNFKSYGLVHTGMIGDAIIGSFFKKNEYNSLVQLGQGAYSQELINRLNNYKFKYHYENEEIFCLYTRAFLGANGGIVDFQEYTETYSPFCDVDFLEFCYSIPLKLRYNHKIYFDWILKCYPDAANYKWEKTKQKIKPIHNREIRYMLLGGKKLPFFSEKLFYHWLYGAILRQLGLRKKGVHPKTIVMNSKANMNPLDYWLNTNLDLSQFIKNYWNENKFYVDNVELRSDLEHLMCDCTGYDQIQALSVLSAIKLIKQ